MRFVYVLLLFLCSFFASPAISQFTQNDHFIDLTEKEFYYVAYKLDQDMTYEDVMKRTDWQSIQVGKRWEFLGHPELEQMAVWVKTKFFVPAEFNGYKTGFFCTAIDDEADVYINGELAGSMVYKWSIVPGPTDIDLTKQVLFGQENELVIQIRDVSKNRYGGLLGHVCLYKTLPFSRTDNGGIQLNMDLQNRFTVLLHHGDAVLSQEEKTGFTTTELESMHIPPSILRKDEIIQVVPAGGVRKEKRYRVNLDHVNPTRCNDELLLECKALPDTVKLYEQIQLPITVTGTFDNPFDPEEIVIKALVETPSGKVETISAFFAQDFAPIQVDREQEILLPIPGNPWKLYYRARELGRHTVQLFAQDRTGIKKLDAGGFYAKDSEQKGYLRVSTKDPRFFEFDNGESFYGMGPSGWYRGSHFLFGGNPRWVPVKMMQDYFARKGQNNSTFSYLATFHYGKLYLENGFVDQHVAWKLEQTVRAMEEHGIHWIVFHDDIRRFYPYGFDTMPYSVEQGGPCQTIEEVYVNTKAIQMQKNQLRYLISRISDSPAVWIWNCGDESQPGDRFSHKLVRAWLKELHDYIRQIDIYQHAHAIGEGYGSILAGGDVVLLPDWYYSEGGKRHSQHCKTYIYDTTGFNQCLLSEYANSHFPVIIPEGGVCEWNKRYYLSGERYDFPETISFHKHLWQSLFLKCAAGGTEWLCNVMDRDDQLYHANALANFISDESLAQTQWTCTQALTSDSHLRGYVLQSKNKSLVWVGHVDYTWYKVGHHKEKIKTVQNARVTIPVTQNGKFLVEIWDTRMGEITKTVSALSQNGRVTVELDPISNDVAVKIISKQIKN